MLVPIKIVALHWRQYLIEMNVEGRERKCFKTPNEWNERGVPFIYLD